MTRAESRAGARDSSVTPSPSQALDSVDSVMTRDSDMLRQQPGPGGRRLRRLPVPSLAGLGAATGSESRSRPGIATDS